MDQVPIFVHHLHNHQYKLHLDYNFLNQQLNLKLTLFHSVQLEHYYHSHLNFYHGFMNGVKIVAVLIILTLIVMAITLL